jgi:L-fuculose-phosphate aldolase
MVSEIQLRQDIVEVGRRLWLRGYVAANDGNISIRVGPDEFLCTPSGVSKGFMTPEMMIKVNCKGEKIAGDLNPSTEIKMHLRAYQDRPDVNAVVHAHPPVCTAFAVAGIPLPKSVLPEVIMSLGSIPLTEYGTPSTDEIPQAIAKYLKDHDAFLLERHGALTIGPDVFNAYYKMETVEHFATVILATRQLGGAKELEPQQMQPLIEIYNKRGHKGVRSSFQEQSACEITSGLPLGPEVSEEERLTKIVTAIVQRVLAEKDKDFFSANERE